MNFNTFQQIWVSRKDLTVTQYEFKNSTRNFTDNIICVVIPGSVLPYFNVYLHDWNT
jgi:hypothetical protein